MARTVDEILEMAEGSLAMINGDLLKGPAEPSTDLIVRTLIAVGDILRAQVRATQVQNTLLNDIIDELRR